MSNPHPASKRFFRVRPIETVFLALLTVGLTTSPSVARTGPEPGFVPIVTTAKAAEPLQVQWLEDRNQVSILEVTGSYDKDLPDGSANAEARQAVAQEYFASHADDHDYLIVFSTFEFDTGDAVAFYTGVRNDVLGIGSPTFDASVAFGSAGRLQGYVDMAALARYELSPFDPAFEKVLRAASHEILHRWGIYLELDASDGQPGVLLGKDGNHWSFLADTGASVMYGNDWQDQGDGTFRSVAISTFFSPLDLYLAGFYGPEEVPPFTVIESPGVDPTRGPELGATVTGTARTVTIDEIIDANGPRVPAAANSQHDFRAAFLLLVRPGETVDDATLGALDGVRRELLERFTIMTGGRGVLEAYPAAVSENEPGSPTPVEPGTVRSGEASLADGLTWLRGSQTADGFWEDTAATRRRDTTVVLETLERLDPIFTGGSQARLWLAAEPGLNLDDLSRSTAILNGAGTADRSDLLARGNTDGGWGLGPRHGSSVLDTALALLALAGHDDVPASSVEDGARFLLDHRSADGGWGHVPGGSSRTGVTTVVLRALSASGHGGEIADALAWLAGRQNADGGFGDSPSTAHDTANVLRTLIELGAAEQVNAPAAVHYLRTRQTVAGSWEGSVYTTALAVRALKGFLFPNYRLGGEASVEPAAPRDGDRVSITLTLRNDGNSVAPENVVRLFLGQPEDGIPAAADVVVPVLGPRASAQVRVVWDSLDHPGPVTLVAVADPDGTVEEMSELDNRLTVAIDVAPAPAGAELAVEPADVAVIPAHPALLPAELAIAATVRNFGLTDAEGVRVVLWQGEAGTGTVAGEVTVAIPSRSSSAANFVTTLDAPGTTVFSIEVDPDNVVAEDDETDNRTSVEVTTQPNIDLEVTAADLALDGGAFLGLDARFQVTLHNRGTEDAPVTTVRFEVSDGTTVIPVQEVSPSIAAAGSETLEIPWRVDRVGALSFDVRIDPDNQIIEGDEGNNTASLPFTASEVLGANLSIDYREIVFDPAPGLQGAPLTVTATVHNDGSADLNDVGVAFFAGDPANGGMPLGQTTVAVPAGGAAAAAVTSAPLATADDPVVFVVIDPDGLVDELDESDNVAFRDLTVLSLPDLAVSSSAIEVAPANPVPGETATVTVRLANLGEQPAADVALRITDSTGTVEEQAIALAGPAGTVTASLPWTFGSDAVTLRVEVDPAGLISELSIVNNVAERLVTPAGREGQKVSYRYFSPNGDGVRDTTTFFFATATPSEAVVEVRNEDGIVVRQSEPQTVTDQGSFEWGGRRDDGTVVPDGEYRLVAMVGADAVSDAVVSVDTNRSSLADAFDTPFQLVTNLTCDWPFHQYDSPHFTLPYPYETAYFTWDGSYSRPLRGIFAVPLGATPQRIVSGFVGRLVVSDDGERMAYRTSDGLIGASTEGTPLALIPGAEPYGFGFGPGTQDLYYALNNSLVLQPLDGSGPAADVASLYDTYATAYAFNSGYFDQSFSPNGKSLYVDVTGDVDQIVDLESGLRSYEFSWDHHTLAWSPDSSLVATLNNSSNRDAMITFRRLVTETRDHGFWDENQILPRWSIAELEPYQNFDLPYVDTVDDRYFLADSLSWASSGERLAVEVYLRQTLPTESGPASVGYGGIAVYRDAPGDPFSHAGGGKFELVGGTQPIGIPGLSYHISTWDGSDWIERSELHFGNHYHEESVDLTGYLPDSDGEYKVRIRQVGGEAAHVDRIGLSVGSGPRRREVAPAAARLAGGSDVLPLVTRLDRDVMDLHGAEVEVRFDVGNDPLTETSEEATVALSLVAREEVLRTLETRPFTYPVQADAVYEVTLDGRGGLQVDGRQTGDDDLAVELFDVMSRPGTGHPSARVYGYATSDEDHLYAALDFTVDNTMDGDRDWGALHVRTAGGWREFRVNVSDSSWGAVGFTRTGKVHHQHKYYEFRVPLAEIGAEVGDTVELRFSAYGTAAIVDEETVLLPRFGHSATWIPGSEQILYTHEADGSAWIVDLDDARRIRRVLLDFTSPADPVFLDGGRRLLLRDSHAILDPQSECYNSEGDYGFFLIESAANLGAKLEAEAVADSGAFALRGTATDLHFKSYRLDYAREDVAGFWTPIGEEQDEPVLDGDFATWTPPEAGWYRVRLTVEDLAGNRTTAVQRVSAGSAGTASLANLSLSSRFVSPNGDGEHDTTTVRYQTFEPVHLEFRVVGQSGDRVRTIVRDHVDPGTYTVDWDGRDDHGLPVADGDYRIEVQQYRLSVTIDTRPPTGEIEMLLARRLGGVDPKVRWCVEEANFQGGVVEIGEGTQPQNWTEVGALSLGNMCLSDDKAKTVDLADFVDRRYRLRLWDAAGNESLMVGPTAPVALILHHVAVNDTALVPIPLDNQVEAEVPVSALRFAATTTSSGGLADVQVQVRSDLVPDAPWQEVAVDQVSEPGGMPSTSVPAPRFEALWSNAPLGLNRWQIRLRGVDGSAQEVLSNVLYLGGTPGLVNYGPLADDLSGLDPTVAVELSAALGQAELNPFEDLVIWGYIPDGVTVADPILVLSSDDDPNFVGGKVFAPVVATGRIVLFAPGNLVACRTYQSIISGRNADSGLVLRSNSVDTAWPCLDLSVEVLRDSVATCDAPPSGVALVAMVGESLDGEQLQLLSLALDDPLDVIFNVNRPVDDLVYNFEIDTAEMAERYHRLYVRLTNEAGEETLRIVPLAVDRSAPQVELTHPSPAQTVCGPAEDQKTLEGTVTDLGGLAEYRVLYQLGGSGSWQPHEKVAVIDSPPGEGPLAETVKTGTLSSLVELLRGVHGEVALRLEAEDLGGNVSCAELTFSVDSRHSAAVVVPQPFLSPDGNGVLDETQVVVNVSEPSTVDVEVFATELRDLGPVAVGAPLRQLALATPVFDLASFTWDGRRSDGTTVADGRYLAVVTIRDACGNERVEQVSLTVDTAAPSVAFLSPVEGAQLASLVTEVTGTVEDAALERWDLDVAFSSDSIWKPIAAGAQVRTSALLGQWNLFGLSGPHTLRLTAVDLAGNRSEVRRQVEVVGTGELISLLEAVPELLSPDGNGEQDSTAIRFSLLQDAATTLEIRDAANTVVRTLIAGAPQPAGGAVVTWDGRDVAGLPVSDGVYRVRLEASTTEGTGLTQEETVLVVVDTDPPSLSLTRPSDGSLIAGTGPVVGTVDDPHLDLYRLSIADAATVAWTQIAEGLNPVLDGDLGSLSKLAEGDYLLRVEAIDAARNRSALVVAFAVDNRAPEVSLDAPVDDDVLSTSLGVVTVLGSAVDEHPGTWRLDYGAGAAPGAWVELASGAGLPASQALATWDVSGLEDGLYTLRLSATDQGGLTSAAQAAVVVSNTPPIVRIDQPSSGALLTEAIAILGAAHDVDFEHYRLEIAAGSSGSVPDSPSGWLELARVGTPVTEGRLLDWRTLPPVDGPYILRLTAVDRAGNSASAAVEVTLDRTPPAPPTGLTATDNTLGTGIDLDWNDNTESDLAGYRVYLDGQKIREFGTWWGSSDTHDPAPEGLLTYTVTAFDRAGHESDPSAPAEVLRDTTPPLTSLEEPREGRRVGGLVGVRVTVAATDLKEYRLLAVTGGSSTDLFRSTVPAQSQKVVEWDTAGLADGDVVLRLESEDVRGNATSDEALVVVDNTPPAAPTGLAATATADDVEVSWNVNNETDLLGYLLYRNGRLVNAHGAVGELSDFALADTVYGDLDQPDGELVYRVAAVDRAGNPSPLSEPASVTLDTRAPHATLVEPEDGARFDGAVYVLATVPDLDVAEVVFEHRAAADTTWTPLSSDSAAPWEATWDSAALGLGYGDYQVRAIATDSGGKSDAAPQEVGFTFTDLDRPAPVSGLAATVDGGRVTLVWQANSEPDLAGYHVDRSRAGGDTLRMTPDLSTATTWTDDGLADDDYLYSVVAVDTFGNEADPSGEAAVSVYTPIIVRPWNPTTEGSVVLAGQARTVAGTPVAGATAEVSRTPASGDLPAAMTDGEGRFSFPAVPLADGVNTLDVTVVDSLGNRSKPATLSLRAGSPPSAPTGLAALASAGDVELAWNPNPEPDVVGYRILAETYLPALLDPSALAATASTEAWDSTTASQALTPSGYWEPIVDGDHPADSQYWAVSWADPAWVSALELLWRYARQPTDFDLEVWDGDGWLVASEIHEPSDRSIRIQLSAPYLTTAVRVVLHSTASGGYVPRLELAQVEHWPLVTDPSYTDPGVADGFHTYRVTAVNDLGFESPPSEPATIAIGDVEPPPAVALSATVIESSVELSWTASDAADLSAYEVLRDGTRVILTTATSHLDAGLLNGTYTYVVRAIDTTGNVSEPSNEVQAVVAVPLPPAPVHVTVYERPEGGALEISWEPAPGSTPYAWRLMSSTVSGGPYETVAELSFTAYYHHGLTNGVTRYYVVHGLDPVGNAGPPSAEASGTPDRVLPVPLISYPGRPGQTVVRKSTVLPSLAGMAEPGLTVTLRRNGTEVATTGASGTWNLADTTSYSNGRLSPDGRRMWLVIGSKRALYEFETRQLSYLSDSPSSAQWLTDDTMIFSQHEYQDGLYHLRTYNVDTGGIEELVALDVTLSGLTVSADASRAAFVGSDGTRSGLFTADLVTGELTFIAPGSTLSFGAVRLNADGSRLAFVNLSQYRVVDLATGEITVVDSAPSSPDLDWSPDGKVLAYEKLVYDYGYKRRIWAWDAATGQTAQLVNEWVTLAWPRWLPDGQILAVRNSRDVYLYDLADGTSEKLYATSYGASELEVSASGHALFTNYGWSSNLKTRLTPPGQFTVFNLPLEPGDNLFTAVGSDSGGATSAESDALLVRVLPGDRPDLRLSAGDLGVAPDHPVAGQAAAVRVTVRNAGTAPSDASEVDLIDLRPDGGHRTYGPFGIPALEVGQEHTLSTVVAFADAGRHTVIATADRYARIDEEDEDNNRAERSVLVLAAAEPAVFVSTDADEVLGHQDVTIALDAVNGGEMPLDGRLEVAIEDAGGYLVAALLDADDPAAAVSLEAGESSTRSFTWNSGNTFAGAYRVRASLFDAGAVSLGGSRGENAALLDEATAPFTILNRLEFDATVTTDRPSYEAGEVARLLARVVYVAGNVPVSGATAHLRVVDGAGSEIAAWQQLLGDLLPGSESTVFADWTAAGPTGPYAVELEVITAEGLSVASSTAPFELFRPLGPPILSATKSDALVVDLEADGETSPGDTVRYVITVANTGEQAASAVTVRDLIPAHTTVVAGSAETGHGVIVTEDPLEADLGLLGAGEVAAVSFEVNVDTAFPAGVGQITNQATVTSAELPALLSDDPELGGAADPTVTPVTGLPILTAEKLVELAVDADGDTVPSPGDTLRYTVVVRNLGNGTAGGVGFADPLPEHVSVVEGSVDSDLGFVDSEDPVLVTVGDLAGGETATLTFEVVVDDPIAPGVSEIVNQGLVISDQLDDVVTDDPAVGGSEDPTVTPISAAPVLAVSKTATLFTDVDQDGLVSPGDELLYRIEVRNAGNTAATAVEIADPVPAHTTLVVDSIQVSRGDGSPGEVLSEDPVRAALGQVDVGTTPALTFRVTVDDPFPTDVLAVVNQATVTSPDVEPVVSEPVTSEVFITPDITAADVSVDEADDSEVEATVAISLSEASNRAVSFAWATIAGPAELGQATAGQDFVAAGGTLGIPAGETAASVAVAVLADLLDEPDETLTVMLGEVTGGVLADGESVVTIVDNDPPPVLTATGTALAEGDDGTVTAVFEVSLSGPSGFDISTTFHTADGTAVSGEDFVGTSGVLTVPAGETAGQIPVDVFGDLVDELDETFTLVLSDPSHVVLGSTVLTATILDDDEALISIDDTEVDEGAAGETVEAWFAVRLAVPADREIRVDYETSDGTATSGVDYQPAAGTLVFPAYTTERDLAVPVFGDDLLEAAGETFWVDLSNAVDTVPPGHASGATIADGTAQGRILDDEVCAGPNLLVNPGADERPDPATPGEIPGWIRGEGDWQRHEGEPEPVDGEATFAAGTAELSELFQDVDVGAFAERIATAGQAGGGQLFAFDGYVRTADEVPPDVARLVVEYRNSGSVVLESFDSGEISSPFEWQPVSDVRIAPAGTATIRVRLIGIRFTEDTGDAFVDALSLRSLRTATLTIDGTRVYEGHSGLTDAVFPVRLACPYDREISATFATADGTALAPDDYLAATGTVTLPSGDTEDSVTVSVVGDEEDEGTEHFFVEISDLGAPGCDVPESVLDCPVLLSPVAVGSVLNDDFCPLSHGYWKEHVEVWPVLELKIGGVWTSAEEMLDLLEYNGPDASNKLALQLVATLLNLEMGSDPYILPVVEEAQLFLELFPSGSDPRGEDRELAVRIKDDLDAYNRTPCPDDGGGGGGGQKQAGSTGSGS